MSVVLKSLIALMRPKHYLKNGLIFVPLLFSGKLLEWDNFIEVVIAAIMFSLVASIVYIFNDIRDIEKDRKHPKKKNRPIAAGAVSVGQATTLAGTLVVAVLAVGYFTKMEAMSWLLIGSYIFINAAYSAGLKNVPVVDVAILAAGFVLRVLFGASVVDVDVSRWLYLTVLAGAFYLGLGKRRGELVTNGTKSRKVNEFYSENFLDKNMYVCSALTLVFYSLWATDPLRHTASLFWTIPLAMILLMTYSLDVEKEGSMGDPVDVLLNNKPLAVCALTYVLLTTYLLYI